MKKKLLLKDIASPILLEYATALGWEETTPVDFLVEQESARLMITRHSPWCCICGGGSFRWMVCVNGKHLCERCASEVCSKFRKYLHDRNSHPRVL